MPVGVVGRNLVLASNKGEPEDLNTVFGGFSSRQLPVYTLLPLMSDVSTVGNRSPLDLSASNVSRYPNINRVTYVPACVPRCGTRSRQSRARRSRRPRGEAADLRARGEAARGAAASCRGKAARGEAAYNLVLK